MTDQGAVSDKTRVFRPVAGYLKRTTINHLVGFGIALVTVAIIFAGIALLIVMGDAGNKRAVRDWFEIFLPMLIVAGVIPLGTAGIGSWFVRFAEALWSRVEVTASGVAWYRGKKCLRPIEFSATRSLDVRRVVGAYRFEFELADGAIVSRRFSRAIFGPAEDLLAAIRAAAPGLAFLPGAAAVMDGRASDLPRCVSPFDAGFLSTMHPGLGQIYNGQWSKGMPLMVVGPLALAYLTLQLYYREAYFIPFIFFVGVIWVMAAGDAALVAERRYRLFQMKRPIPPFIAEDFPFSWWSLPPFAVLAIGSLLSYAIVFAGLLCLIAEFALDSRVAIIFGMLIFMLTFAWIAAASAQILVDFIMQVIGERTTRAARHRRLFWSLIGLLVILMMFDIAPGPKQWAFETAYNLGNLQWSALCREHLSNPDIWPATLDSARVYLDDKAVPYSNDNFYPRVHRALERFHSTGAVRAPLFYAEGTDGFYAYLNPLLACQGGGAIAPEILHDNAHLLVEILGNRNNSLYLYLADPEQIISSDTIYVNRLNPANAAWNVIMHRQFLAEALAAAGPDSATLRALLPFMERNARDGERVGKMERLEASEYYLSNQQQMIDLDCALAALALNDLPAALAHASRGDLKTQAMFHAALAIRNGRDEIAADILRASSKGLIGSLRVWRGAGALGDCSHERLEKIIGMSNDLSLGAWLPPVVPADQAQPPRRTDKGVVFECLAPDTATVILRGDWQDLSGEVAAVVMEKSGARRPDGKCLFRAIIAVPAGTHVIHYESEVFTDYHAWDDPRGILVMPDGSVRVAHNHAAEPALRALWAKAK